MPGKAAECNWRAEGSTSVRPGLPENPPLCYFARPVRPIRL